MTDDELRGVFSTEYERAFAGKWQNGSAAMVAALRAVFEAGRNDGAVYAEHSGQHDRREWHTVGTWLHPGDKIVVMYAEPLVEKVER